MPCTAQYAAKNSADFATWNSTDDAFDLRSALILDHRNLLWNRNGGD